jgi:hypothetical protein
MVFVKIFMILENFKQPAENSKDKPKFFVRYAAGSGGHFLSLLIIALQYPVTLKEHHRGHSQINEINVGHNFGRQWDLKIDLYLSTRVNEQTGVRWLLNNFSFTDTHRDFYVIHTHAISFKPILAAWSDSKVITIWNTAEEAQQLAYNYVSKSELSKTDNLSDIAVRIKRIQKAHGKLTNIDTNDVLNLSAIKNNTQLYSYIILHSSPPSKQTYENHGDTDRLLGIAFSDIFNGNHKNFLDKLIDFLGFSVSEKAYLNALSMIQQYSAAQTKIPWSLPINLYN